MYVQTWLAKRRNTMAMRLVKYLLAHPDRIFQKHELFRLLLEAAPKAKTRQPQNSCPGWFDTPCPVSDEQTVNACKKEALRLTAKRAELEPGSEPRQALDRELNMIADYLRLAIRPGGGIRNFRDGHTLENDSLNRAYRRILRQAKAEDEALYQIFKKHVATRDGFGWIRSVPPRADGL
jgi:hypothetical protein